MRKVNGIELIASENFTSHAVMECFSSFMTNKYSEGQPGARCYGGNEFINEMEVLCKNRDYGHFGYNAVLGEFALLVYDGSVRCASFFTLGYIAVLGEFTLLAYVLLD